MYFSCRKNIGSSFFHKITSGRRFDLLPKLLHLVDNNTIPKGQKKVGKDETIH